MDDASQKTCPADRFNQIIHDPAARAAINLQAAVWYSGCTGLLGKATQPQFLPRSAPSFLLSSQANNVRMAPDELSVTPPSRPLSQAKNVRRAPDELPQIAPSQPSTQLPQTAPSQLSVKSLNVKMAPKELPNQPSAQSKNVRRAPDKLPQTAQSKNLRITPDQLPHSAPSQPSIRSKYLTNAPDQLPQTPVRSHPSSQSSFLRLTPAQLFPSPSKLSSQPTYLTREIHLNMMDNSREVSRPRRAKKPIYRLQVGSKKQQTKVYSETQFQTQQKGNQSKLSVELSQVPNKLLKISLEEQESVCPTRSNRKKLEPNHTDDENNARNDFEEKSVNKTDQSMMTYVSDVVNKVGAMDLSETECDTDIEARTSRNFPSFAGGVEGTDQVKSIKKSVDPFREIPKDDSERDEFNENVVPIDSRAMAVKESNQQDIDAGDTHQPLEDEIGDRNNNVPPVTTTAVEPQKYKYISRWVPFLRKRKLCIEGDLLELDEEPNSKCAKRYFTSKILERESARRVAGKKSVYALEGPMLIPDPATRPMPLFVIEKFKNGVPEDWKNVVDIWASFNDHRVLQSSASQFDLDRFSLCSSEIGSKIVNICAMSDGSLIANMAAVNEGNFLMKQVSSQCLSPDI